MMTIQFLRLGAKTPFVQGFKSEEHPYSVSLNGDSSSLKDAEILLASANVETLQDRVQVKDNVATVDKFFTVRYKDGDLQKSAVKTWSGLFTSCRKIQYLSGTCAIGLTLFALQGPAFYLVVASYVGIVASTCLFGWSLHRYYIAEKELAIWQSPGEDFAKRRKAALQLPLHEMVQNKCYFRPYQSSGTLLGIEMLLVFRRDFKQFATALLERKCESPEEQHRWVADFVKGNPLWIEFFKDNPHVWKFQEQLLQLFELINTLAELQVPQFNKNHDVAKKKSDEIQKNFEEKTKAYCQSQKIDDLTAHLYHSRVLKIVKAECLDKLCVLSETEKTKAKFFCTIVYTQVRALLEEAKKGLLEDKPCELEQDAFADAHIFITENFEFMNNYFQNELDEITASYPQNVIAKAKAEAPKEKRPEYTETYLRFIDAAFA